MHHGRSNLREVVLSAGRRLPADPDTFEVIGHGRARDATRGFLYAEVVERDAAAHDDADPGEPPEQPDPPGWGVDEGRVRFGDRDIAEVDIGTFEDLGGGFARDASGVWHDGDPIEGAHAPTFRVLARFAQHGFAADQHRVYVWVFEVGDWHVSGSVSPLPDADPASFEVIDDVWARDGRRVWVAAHGIASAGVVVADVDVASFEALGDGYARDARRLYSLGRAVPGADPASARVLGHGYAIVAVEAAVRPEVLAGTRFARDRISAWHFGDRVETLDPTSLRVLGRGYVIDARAAWWADVVTESLKFYEFSGVLLPLPGVDPAALRLLDGPDPDGPWAIAGDLALYEDQGVPTARASALRALGLHYATDGERVFFGARPVDGADPATFAPRPGVYRDRYQRSQRPLGRGRYASDAAQVWFDGRPLPERGGGYVSSEQREQLATVDPALRWLDDHYATDGRSVVDLWWCQVLPRVDAASIRAIGDGYAIDRDGPYHQATFRFAPDADRDALRALGGGWATDGRAVWLDGRAVEGVDAATLVVLSGGFAADADRVYGGGRPVEGADRATFVASGRYGAGRDARRVYEWFRQVPGVDASACHDLGDGYLRTPTDIRHQGAALPGVDPARFEALGQGWGWDGSFVWFEGRPVGP